MGHDAAIAALSDRPRLIFDYFTQLFAQVTNPPLDAIREELVTSSRVQARARGEPARARPPPRAGRSSCRTRSSTTTSWPSWLRQRARGDAGIPGLRHRRAVRPHRRGRALRAAIEDVRRRVSIAIALGSNVIILSDRNSNARLAPIPSLLLTAAVHEHLVREKSRTRVGLVVECGDAREVHHIALLIGYGASAVNPYLAFETLDDVIAHKNLLEGSDAPPGANQLHQGGVQGRDQDHVQDGRVDGGVVHRGPDLRGGWPRPRRGRRVLHGHGEPYRRCGSRRARPGGRAPATAWPTSSAASERAHRELEVGGEYQWRREGEVHLFNPRTVFKLQHATRAKRYDIFKEYTHAGGRPVGASWRRCAACCACARACSTPVPVDEVEPVSEIVKRFATGAMSYGSISAEAHETLAIAMNRLGGKSNTGEGGEDPERYVPDANGDLRRSAIKQVASARFGVTSEYLVNADDLQIKIAQGAKPGEGGQLPGHKVYPWIAKTRFSTPGVGLISPPPHHDIYSIEDIAQLIHDLKSANPKARVHVKLVAEVGVGTVAAGVAKAKSDVVLISGHDGGTGASPLTSIKHAGIPWELGLAETQQTLVLNGLRDRIVVQVDGQLKTGRDVVIAALLGAEEFGFATAPLVVSGCVMMRVCHLDTCPVGIATQNPELRQALHRASRSSWRTSSSSSPRRCVSTWPRSGSGRSRRPWGGSTSSTPWQPRSTGRPRGSTSPRSWPARGRARPPTGCCRRHQDHGLDRALDHRFLEACRPAIEHGEPVAVELPITTSTARWERCSATRSPRRDGGAGLADDTITSPSGDRRDRASVPSCHGASTLRLIGDANDYLAKGLSGGRIVVRPPESSPFVRRGADHRRQRRSSTGPRRGSATCGTGGRALLRPQLGRARPWWRVWATTGVST